MPEECIRILESKVRQEETAMKQAQLLGQKMDHARARFRRAAESGEKAMDALQVQARIPNTKRTWASSCRKPRCQ